MSRCFPFPPPSCALTSAGKEALIESIKFQKEKVNVDQQRKKDRRREKKAKREGKKAKRHLNQDSSDIVHGRIDDKFWADAKAAQLLKGSSFESEQLERSSLTEEHAKPVGIRGPSSSSDSTENSNKRKRLPSPVDSRGHGKIIRIRLPSKNKNQPDASVDEQKHCSTPCRTQFPPQTVNDSTLRQRSEGFCSTSGPATMDKGRSFVLKTGGRRNHLALKQMETPPVFETIHLPSSEGFCSTSGSATMDVGKSFVLKTGGQRNDLASKQIVTGPVTMHLPASDAVLTPIQKEGLLYRNLIENWTPPRFQDAFVDAPNEDWLLGADNKVERSVKSMCRDESMSFCNTSSLWPCAQYLAEVDVCALPYTLPF